MSPRAAIRRYPRVGRPTLPTLREGRFSQSVERGRAILGCFTPERPLLGIAEIADALGMSRSTTHRYTVTLLQPGYLEQPPNSKLKYRLAPLVTDLGMRALGAHPLRLLARPMLDELRSKIHYTVSSAVLVGDEIMLIDRLRGFRGDARLGLDLGPSSRLPAYCTSMGKLLLANLSDQEQDKVVKRLVLRKHGPNSITSKPLLRAELEAIRELGNYAVCDEELKADVRSIAFPVRAAMGEVIAAVNVDTPVSMVSSTELVNDLGPRVAEAAENVFLALSRLAAGSHEE